MRPGPLGQVECCGDGKARLAVVEDFLDAISVAFQHAGHLRIERRTFGKAAQRPDEDLAQFALVSGHISLVK